MSLPQRRSDDRSGGIAPEDEDLFDFPVLELTAEGVRERGADPSLPFASRGARVEGIDPALPRGVPPASDARISAPHSLELERGAATNAVPDAFEPAGAIGGSRVAVSITRRFAAKPWTRGLALVAVGTAALACGTWAWRERVALDARIDELGARIDTWTAARTDGRWATGSPAAPSSREHPPAPAPERAGEADATLAAREIEAGEYAAARVRLFRSLAAADAWPARERDAAEARAVLLVGDSYAREATARGGVGP